MSFKSIVTLLSLSVVVFTGVPALATQVAHPDNRCRLCQHKDAACREAIFGTCVERGTGAQPRNQPYVDPDGWPGDMILD